MAWKVQPFAVHTPNGQRVVAGWVKDVFALDFRPVMVGDYEGCGGWAITHLSSGYSFGAVVCSLEEAQQAIDLLAARCDWSLATPQTTRFFKSHFSAWIETIEPGRVVLTDQLCAPWATFGTPLFCQGAA